MAKTKFYAVRRGREGPKIYERWFECENNVSGWPGSRYKSFPTKEAALAWLEDSDDSFVGLSSSNPWLNVMDTQTGHVELPTPRTPPHVPIDLEPFTADSISPPAGNAPESPRKTPSSAILLSDEQEHILKLVREGKNIFFTGSAGTGKSVLLREIISHFGGEVSEELAITASTGIAAVNIGGTTLHSFAGIGLGTESVEKLIAKILSNQNSKKRWRRTRTLIIDEISMVDGSLFDKLEHIARAVRNNARPFGGIQLVLSGDFCQLPPVPERHDGTSIPILFAFEASSWDRCFREEQSERLSVYRLTKVFRQRDQAFVDMLNSMRNGQLDAKTSAQFYKLSRPIHYSDGLEPCELFPRREQVSDANRTRLRRIAGASRPYTSMDIGGYDIRNQPVGIDQAKKLLERLVAPETLELKVGAQVMLIKNLVQGHLVNGSLGQVVEFQSLGEARRRNMEVAEVDRSKDPLRRQAENDLTEIDESSILGQKLWPVVRFTNARTLLVTPGVCGTVWPDLVLNPLLEAEFEIVNVHGIREARRDQIPLILAWALSIHKSQGQTLERVKVDLGKTFEKGQAYVALSRATSMDGLQVLNFHPSKVMAHTRVLEWQKQLDWNFDAQMDSPEQFDKPNVPARHHSNMLDQKPSVMEPYDHDEFDEFDEFDSPEALAGYWEVSLSE